MEIICKALWRLTVLRQCLHVFSITLLSLWYSVLWIYLIWALIVKWGNGAFNRGIQPFIGFPQVWHEHLFVPQKTSTQPCCGQADLGNRFTLAYQMLMVAWTFCENWPRYGSISLSLIRHVKCMLVVMALYWKWKDAVYSVLTWNHWTG